MHFVRGKLVYPYSSTDTSTAWKKSVIFFLSEKAGKFLWRDDMFHLFSLHVIQCLREIYE